MSKDSNKDKENLSFEEKFKIFKEYIEENNKIPIKSTNYKSVNIGRWWGTQKSYVSSKEDEKYKTLAINNIIKQNLDEYIKNKDSNETKKNFTYDEKLEALINYVEKEDKIPTKKSSYNDINVGYFLINLKTKLNSKEDEVYKTLSKNKKLKINLDEYLQTKEKNKDKKNLSFDESFNLLTEFIDKNERLPICKEKFKDIGIGNWYQHQKQKIDSKNNEIYKKISKNKIAEKNLDEYLSKK